VDESQSTHRKSVPEIGVLAPWPIFTVTIERGSAGKDDIYVHAGGQGFWVARMIANLGGKPVLCGPIGGESGVVVQALVEAEGVALHAIAAEGWNGGYVHDRRDGDRKFVAEMKSPRLNRHEADDLYDAVLAIGLRTGIVVFTGVVEEDIVPAKFYRRLAHDLGRNGVTVVADLSDGPLNALDGGVSFLKVSQEELIRTGYSSGPERAAVLEGLKALQRSTGARNVIVSRAEEPAFALLGERLVEVEAPRFRPLDHRGAGDSMTASLAVAQARGLGADETLRLAAAAGALNVTRHGLGTGKLDDIEEVAAHVTIRELSPLSHPAA
jgi:1-phosphofructokinase